MTTTIHDVARRARVSVTTVSRALTQPDLLRSTTRERVLRAAKALAYHPNRAARSLITGKTGNIGIVVPDLSNPFYPGVVRGVQLRAHQAGYAVFLADSNEDMNAEENLVHAMAKQVDGVIVCAPFASDAALRRLRETTSLVLVNRRAGDIPAVLMEIAKQRPCAGRIVAVFTPMTSPLELTSGPPELPGLRAASVWMTSSIRRPDCERRLRTVRAEIRRRNRGREPRARRRCVGGRRLQRSDGARRLEPLRRMRRHRAG